MQRTKSDNYAFSWFDDH